MKVYFRPDAKSGLALCWRPFPSEHWRALNGITEQGTNAELFRKLRRSGIALILRRSA